MAIKVDVKQLLESGAHYGHKTSRWHPKMAPYIHSKKNNAHIIDLVQTTEMLEIALAEIAKVASQGKQVLFVGTKRQAKDTLKKTAEELDMPYVTERWLGGMLTNTKTMSGRVKHLKKLEERMDSGELASKFNKLEVQRYQEEIDSMNRLFGGVKNMAGKPGIVFVTDVNTDNIAVKEANKLKIPVVAIVDTNCDPSDVDFVVPANDDAIKSISLITGYIAEAIKAGKLKKKAAPKAESKAEKPTEAKK